MSHQVCDCPHCEKRLKVPAKAVGKQIRCPSCSNEFLSPAAARIPIVTAVPLHSRVKDPESQNRKDIEDKKHTEFETNRRSRLFSWKTIGLIAIVGLFICTGGAVTCWFVLRATGTHKTLFQSSERLEDVTQYAVVAIESDAADEFASQWSFDIGYARRYSKDKANGANEFADYRQAQRVEKWGVDVPRLRELDATRASRVEKFAFDAKQAAKRRQLSCQIALSKLKLMGDPIEESDRQKVRETVDEHYNLLMSDIKRLEHDFRSP